MNRINSKAAVLSVAAVMGFTAFASADTVDMKFTGTGKGSNVKVTLTNNTFNVFAGQLKHTMQNGTGTGANLSGNYITFCSDLYETVTSSYKTYTLTDLNNLPDSSPMGFARAGAIWNIYQAFGSSALNTNANNDLAAAFQIAIWEIATDFNPNTGLSSLNVNSGSFKAVQTNGNALTGAIATNLNNIFNAAVANVSADPSLFLTGLMHSTAQDQIVATTTTIPTPATGALAALGLLCMGRRRR